MAQSNVENLSPHVIRQIYKELCELSQDPLEGIKVVYNEEDITSVQADIDGPLDTPYFGGSFRIRLQLGKSFPTSPPKGFFVTKIFHPNVGRNGEICVNTLKKDWNQDLGIKHILLTIKCLLIVPNPESALNEEAGKMLLERYEDYCKRAKMFTEIHAPRAKQQNPCEDSLPASSTSSSVNSTNIIGNSNNNNNNNTTTTTSNTLADKTALPSSAPISRNSGAVQASQKHPLDGICCSEEPASKRLNTLIDCYNSTADQLDLPNLQQQQQQHSSLKINPATASANSSQALTSKQSSQSKFSGSNLSNKNRGLKRVLRLRS